jgi:hypothetical protein
LLMGGTSPETCWASYKYRIIKILIHCCILLDFSLWIIQVHVCRGVLYNKACIYACFMYTESFRNIVCR